MKLEINKIGVVGTDGKEFEFAVSEEKGGQTFFYAPMRMEDFVLDIVSAYNSNAEIISAMQEAFELCNTGRGYFAATILSNALKAVGAKQ